MLELHLDPVGGIAGDMFAAAMLDLRPDLQSGLREMLALCPLIPDVEFELVAHNDGVLTGHRFLVRKHGHDKAASHQPEHHQHSHHHGHQHAHATDEHEEHHHPHEHTDWQFIREALVTSRLDPETIRHAVGIFSLLAEAEAKVHGMSTDNVAFHEVGAWDSIADIVSAAWLIKMLGVSRWTVGPIPLGSGRVKTAHGLLPVPAPATALLLEGFDTIDDGLPGERVTPTGAAILRYLCERGRAVATPRRLTGSSHGFGTRRLPSISNCLRVLAFEADREDLWHEDRVAELECEIDDQTAEDLAHAVDHLRRHPGVLDVIQAPVFGKKGRMMTHLRVLAKPGFKDEILSLIFDETTTIGIRQHMVERSVLKRTMMVREEDGHVSNLKIVDRPSGRTAKREADDIASIEGHAGRMRARLATEMLNSAEGED